MHAATHVINQSKKDDEKCSAMGEGPPSLSTTRPVGNTAQLSMARPECHILPNIIAAAELSLPATVCRCDCTSVLVSLYRDTTSTCELVTGCYRLQTQFLAGHNCLIHVPKV
jgi:hypothetical protein